MKELSFDAAIHQLRQTGILDSVILDDDFLWRNIINADEEVVFDLSFINCQFNKRFGTYCCSLKGKLTIKNCQINEELDLFNVFIYDKLTIESTHVVGYSGLDCGAFYGDVILLNNTFEAFVNFEDQDIKGHSSFINNKFIQGSNLMHPKGGPSGAHFAFSPYLEGNTGLERYVRPED